MQNASRTPGKSQPVEVEPLTSDLHDLLIKGMARLTGTTYGPEGREPSFRQCLLRSAFMVVVSRLFPEFSRSLQMEVLPVYNKVHNQLAKQAGEDHPRALVSKRGRLYLQIRWSDLQEGPGERLKDALLKWATPYNIEREEWILEQVLETLHVWFRFSQQRKSMVWQTPAVSLSPLPAAAPTIGGNPPSLVLRQVTKTHARLTLAPDATPSAGLPRPYVRPWHPESKALSRHVGEHLSRLHEILDQQVSDTIASNDNSKWTKVAASVKGDHFISLAIYQIGGHSHEAIADWWGQIASKDASTVYRGVSRAAAQLGLKLRHGKRGPKRN